MSVTARSLAQPTDLSGQVAIGTGATRGRGVEVARCLAVAGAAGPHP